MMHGWASIGAMLGSLSSIDALINLNETNASISGETISNISAPSTARFPPFYEHARFVPFSIFQNLSEDTKYFHEVKDKPHFDIRFYDSVHSEANRSDQLRELFREFAALMDHYAVPYFLDFGSLIGWYWEGKSLPWDDDIDISIQWSYLFVLQWISEVYQNDRYELKVNPNFMFVRMMRKGQNMIDARFISKTTGVFIDIVAITEEEPFTSSQLFLDEYLNRTLLPNIPMTNFDKFDRAISNDVYYPPQRTEWNGIPTWVPHDVERRLTLKYGALATTQYGERTYDWTFRVWFLKPEYRYKMPCPSVLASLPQSTPSSLQNSTSLPLWYRSGLTYLPLPNNNTDHHNNNSTNGGYNLTSEPAIRMFPPETPSLPEQCFSNGIPARTVPLHKS